MSVDSDMEASPRSPRRPGLKAFLPLSEDLPLSTHGRNLQGLMRSLSSTPHRRNSILRSHDPYSDDEGGRADLEGRRSWDDGFEERRIPGEERRLSNAAAVLMTPQMRSQRLIGSSNPRYRWERYFKTEEELKQFKKPIRKYYERNNSLIQQYLYIDKLLDSSLPHDLIQEYHQHGHSYPTKTIDIPNTITEELASPGEDKLGHSLNGSANGGGSGGQTPIGNTKVKRTPKNLYRVQQANENTPLLESPPEEEEEARPLLPDFEPEEDEDSQSPQVTFAIYLNLAANTILLILKVIVTVLTSSVSVLASMVDAALDFLSTAIIWTTTRMISQQDQYKYPVGRRRLEPIGVLVFSVIMITSFFQVGLEGLKRLTSGDHEIVQLSPAAIAIMSSTVLIKGACWLWCRLINNSSVQALAQDAMTDVVFNIFSIIFPFIGYFAQIWWLDSLGGILLALYVIINWSFTTTQHIRNLTGAAATADERNVLLYLTMRFAKTIKQIQGLQAYHAGDKLNVEVDIVLDEATSLRDSHDLGESLQYVLESVPTVDRAFVHLDYLSWNLPTHMEQQE
ncbi:hypothetical protein FKW77_007279 [Venturia effusa]|uniref:Cation efflux protein transmembrane domain-containing protein n=1 Tax=Venturia effusa TaxID=50376 RepID=A0A517L3N1_9PEZI|nr:hypothetical protein FKW77_007279 [Venturia effusa]